ncbi:MAG: hypothetical protein IKS07_05330 [Lachnospiraceae bacterium]|nr:hypothetical protein [Lachnospiraceae bacterium]
MKEEKKEISGIFSMLLNCSAALLVAACALFTVLLPEPDLLYRENRKAASRPSMAVESLIDGSFGEALTAYVDDRVALRQFWIDAKCFVDEAILRKTEENGILIGKDRMLFSRAFPGSEDAQLEQNLDAITEFASNSEIPVTVMIVPSAAAVYPEKLPMYAPQEQESEKIAAATRKLSETCQIVDVYQVLCEHRDDYLYYRNDHHWTTFGAVYAYVEFARALNRDPALPDWDNAAESDGFLGTHYAKSRYWKAHPDTISYFPTESVLTVMRVLGDAEFEEEKRTLPVNPERLEGYDKYAAFLDGNNGYSVLEGQGTGRILVVKDSFANCFVPLMEHAFERIGIVDYRNYAYGLTGLVEKERYEQILILYSFASLKTDNRLVFLNRPGS